VSDVLPSGWTSANLEAVAIWASGGTPSRSNPSFYLGTIPWFKTGELGARVIIESGENISPEAVALSSAKIFRKGSVVLAMYGATIGKVSILGIDAATNQACAVGNPDAVDSLFLYYYLLSQTKAFIDAGKGGAQPNISQGIVKNWPILVPPRNEQTRIVEKLEELLSDLDAGIAELKAAQRKLVQYRQSLLKSAVEGVLTTSWREQAAQTQRRQSGAVLLQRILHERRTRWESKQLAKFKDRGKAMPKDWRSKYSDPAPPCTTDLPELPVGWVWASLDMLGEIVSGVTKGTKRDSSISVREVPYLRVANVQRGYLDLSEVKTILATERDIEELTLRDGDVMFNEGGDRDKLGRGWVWCDEVASCIHQNHVFRLRPYLRETLPELISHHGNTFGKTWFQSAGKQTTNLASISMGILRAFPVPIAPGDEQQEILSQLEQQIEVLNHQENSVAIGLKQADAQRKNILKFAFAGQLVPQDPSDEPASVLLERIRKNRAERESQPRDRRARIRKIAA
jgi:type I restriction enzyme, S subunit